MRTRNLFTAVLLSLSSFAVAQSGASDIEKKSSDFQSHWYMQIQAGASHTLGEAKFGDLISPAAGIYGGYQFTPLWGLRAGIAGWQSKGAWVNPKTIYKYNYLQGNIDATLDLGNLFGGYKNRIVNPYIFAGIGLNGGFNNDEAVALSNQGYNLAYLWDKSKFNVAGRAGLGLNFRLAEKVLFNIEANANVLSDKYNSKKAGNADWQFNLLGGFTFKFGKSGKKAEPIVYEQPAPVQPEPAPVEEKKEEPAPTPVVVEVKPMTQNIFFAISSSDIRESENSKIASLVEYMKENPSSKVTVCGYADKQTGNARFNKTLSKKRAESVAERLKSEGISADRITVDYKGDTEQPFSTMEQNRVSICIAE